MDNKVTSDYDSGWKEAIEVYIDEFLLFFFPQIHKDIDFSKPVEFLNKEFSTIVKDSEEKKRYVDKLIKVYLNDGTEQWLLIHIEVQTWQEKDFEKRLYVYNYRIFDRYDKEVITLVIMADENPDYKPGTYSVKRWGFEHIFKFPVIKLLNYKEKIDIETAVSPFEIIVYAHLKTLETKNNYQSRLFWKLKLVKLLYQKGFSKEDILKLYRFIDWVMALPEKLKETFHQEIIKYEEEKQMPYVTTAESIGIKKGIKMAEEKWKQSEMQWKQAEVKNLQEAIEDLIEIKFQQPIAPDLKAKLLTIDNSQKLREIKNYVKGAANIEEIRHFVDNIS
jgi:hypothetical protein